MNYNEQAYIQYVEDLRSHLFKDISLEEIIKSVEDCHRKRRFVTMYILRDFETFKAYYNKRLELELEEVFNEAISTLFYKNEKLLIKRKLISRLQINEDMISKPVSEHVQKVVTKDLQTFVWHATKQVLNIPVV